LDAWFQQQLAEADPEKRMQIFHQISRYIFEQVYWLGLWQDPDLWGISGRLTNVRLSGVTPFFSIAEWDLTP
jgi:ABC-type transport system substrate-binding protein